MAENPNNRNMQEKYDTLTTQMQQAQISRLDEIGESKESTTNSGLDLNSEFLPNKSVDWEEIDRKRKARELFEASRIQRTLAERYTFEKFEPSNNLTAQALQDTKRYAEAENNHCGLFIYSTPLNRRAKFGASGTGKTHLAVAIGLEKLKQGQTVKYYPVNELLDDIRPRPYRDELELSQIKGGIIAADYLIFDDFGVEHLTDWVQGTLYRIINRRYNHRGLRHTIITSNLTLAQIAQRMGDDRIASRLTEMCYPINTGNEDFRQKLKPKRL